MKTRVCDLIATCIADTGISNVFMVSGGGLLYLTDGLYKCDRLTAICCHHEQAAAMAAVGYAKYSGFGCAYVTTGCGGTNALTGVLNAWQDNTPCIFISGQCKRKETIRYRKLNIRQLGVQEADIVTIVQSITKYAVMLDNEQDVLYEIEKAIYLAKEGRPGPVWVDIPMDIQSAWVETDDLRHYIPPHKESHYVDLSQLESDLVASKRPVILAGGGIRSSNTTRQLKAFAERYNIPVVCSRMGTDVLETTHPLNIGRIGNKGVRSANFTVQNADFLLVLGSRLSVSSTGQEYEFFARGAKVAVVDIDEEEHKKGTVHIEQFYCMDLRQFFEEVQNFRVCDFSNWAAVCLEWKNRYPVCLPEYYTSEQVNLYVFIEELSKQLKDDSVVVTDAGSTTTVPPQGIKTTTSKQRYIASGGQGEMGFALPAAVGVSLARNCEEVLAIVGDGSLQMNIQELQTVKYYNIPIKLFVWNNNGYLSIRASQGRMFDGRLIGTDQRNGVSFPNLEKISDAYGLKYYRITNTKMLVDGISEVLKYNGPVVCEVMCIPDQPIQPSVSSKQLADGTLVSSPIEDMAPFLPREELKQNMFIPLVEKE